MTRNSEHLQLRSKLIETANGLGLSWRTHGSVYPPQTRYSTVFMTAQRDEFSWVYGEQTPPQEVSNEVGTGWCVRSDAITKAGKSNRHLCSFEMFGMSGIMREDDAIENIINLLINGVGIDKSNISANTGSNNENAITPLKDNHIRVNFMETDFKRADTNRTGHRVEFNVDFESTSRKKQIWEVQNLVVLTHINGKKIERPIVDSGGSLERLVAIHEKEESVYHTSIFKKDINAIKAEIDNPQNKGVETLVDLLRTGLIMAQSGFHVGTKTRQEQTFRKVVREIGLISILNNLNPNSVKNVLNTMNRNLRSWDCYKNLLPFKDEYIDESGMLIMFNTMQQNYDKIYQKLVTSRKEGLNLQTIGKKLSQLYDGGTESGLVQLALVKLDG